MSAERYGRPAGVRAGSLGAAVALNGAIIGALLFSAPIVTRIKDRVLQTENIPIADPPPPEPVPEPQRLRPEQKATRPIERVETSAAAGAAATGFVLPPAPPTGAGTLDGAGPGIETILPPPPADPIYVEASVDPRYAAAFQPADPPGEVRAERAGRVTVRVLISTDGRVKAVERIAAASDAFFRATERQALTRWRFRPATRDGIAVEAWRTMTVRFELASAG